MKKKLFFISAFCLFLSFILSACSVGTVPTPSAETSKGAVILTTYNAGSSWEIHTIQDLSGNSASVYGISSFSSQISTLSCIGGNGSSSYIMKSTDYGANWGRIVSILTNGDFYDITKTSIDGKGFSLKLKNGSSYINMTTDNGSSWTEAPDGISQNMKAMDFGDALRGIIIPVDYTDSIFITTDGGSKWISRSPIPAGKNLNAVKFVNTSNSADEIVCGNSGKILRTSNSGSSWEEVTSPVTDTLSSIDFIDPVGIIVGNKGTILRTEDGGYYWTAIPSGTTNDLYKVYCESSYYWAVGENVILRSSDQGATWTIMRNVSNEYYNDLIFIKEAGVVVGSRQ